MPGAPDRDPQRAGGHDLRQIHESRPDGGIVLTTAVPEQTVVRVMATDADALLAGAAKPPSRARRARRAAALRGRLLVLHARPADARAHRPKRSRRSPRRSAASPAAGFYTCGEFARVTGSIGIHNSSVALLCPLMDDVAGRDRAPGGGERRAARAAGGRRALHPLTLARATRLSQIVSVLGQRGRLRQVVERASVEVMELFFADIALLMLGADDAITIAATGVCAPATCPRARSPWAPSA